MQELDRIEDTVLDLGDNDLDEAWRDYVEHAVPVGVYHPESISPFGLVHVLGNVSEWTETVPSQLVDGDLIPLYSDRVFTGFNWHASTKTARLVGLSGRVTASLANRANDIGFRCAKSVRP
jgi:formylglycine-generating enzyme required for sulfatase activity